MKMAFAVLASAVAAILMSSCGPSTEELRTESELSALRNQLRGVETSLAESTNSTALLERAQREHADAFEALKSELVSVREQLNRDAQAAEAAQESRGCEVRGEIFIVTEGRTNVRLGAVDVFVFQKSFVARVLDETRRAITEETKLAESAVQKADAVLTTRQAEYDRLQAEYTGLMKNWKRLSAKRARDDGDRLRALIRLAEEGVLAERKARDVAALALERARASGGPHRYIDAMTRPMLSTKTNSDGRFSVSIPRDCDPVLVAWAERLVGRTREVYHWIVPIQKSRTEANEVVLSNHNLFNSADDFLNE